MPNIKPISDLRNYSDVLRDVSVGAPVFLTKNGRGRYAILDMQDYEIVLSDYYDPLPPGVYRYSKTVGCLAVEVDFEIPDPAVKQKRKK